METLRKILPAFTDERGTITNILENEDIRHIGIITSRAQSVRGNHYHKKGVQYVYVLSGRLELKTRSVDGDKVESVLLAKSDLAITPALVIHTMHFLEDSVILFFDTESRADEKYEENTVRTAL